MKHKNNRSCTLVFIFILFIAIIEVYYILIVLEFTAIIGSRILFFSSFVFLQLSKSITSTMNIVSPSIGREAADKKTEEEAVKSQNDLKILGNSGWIPPLSF